MTRNNVVAASATAVVVVALLILAYQLGSDRSRSIPEAVQSAIDQRQASLDEVVERLDRLESELVSLRDTIAKVSPEGTDRETSDDVGRLGVIESDLSALKLRVKGLEEDPVTRGFSFIASENAELRREGVNLLSRVAKFDPEARAAIRGLLTDPSARVREQATQKLRDLKDKEAVPELLTLLADTDARTRRRAVLALGAVEARDAARGIGQRLVSDADDRVREEAADVLGRLGSPEAAEFLVEALKDRNQAVRGEAIASLGEMGATSSAPALRAIYDRDPGNHRRRLVLALKALGDEEPVRQEVDRLSTLITGDPDERVRQRAVRELAVLARDSSRQVFSQALEDPSAAVRREAEKALR